MLRLGLFLFAAGSGGLADVTPLTYDEWSDGHGLTAAQRQPDATPNQDGVPNALKYLLGYGPLERVPAESMPQVALPSLEGLPHLSLEVNRDPAAIEAVCLPRISEDLAGWAEDMSRIVVWENGATRFRAGVDVGGGDAAFLSFGITILKDDIAWGAPPGTIVYPFTGGATYPLSGRMPGLWYSPVTVANLPDWGVSANQASQGYAAASGSTNLYASQLNVAETPGETAPHVSISLAPAINKAVWVNALSFGARTLVYPVVDPGPGPKRYELRTSADDFSSTVASGNFNTAAGAHNYWYWYSHDLSVAGEPGEGLELRLYLLGATAGSRGGAFRIDDLAVSAVAVTPSDHHVFYVSPEGSDAWSGHAPEPNAAYTDGPFATIWRARDAVRQLRRNGVLPAAVDVFIREGTYRIEAPLVFTDLDSGTADTPVTYQAYPGERPVISGARPVGGWTETAPGRHEALVPPAVNRGWIFRQLFMDERRMTLARTPNEGYFRMAGPADRAVHPPQNAHQERFYNAYYYRFHRGQLRAWGTISDVNLVAFYSWNAGILPLAWVDEATRTFHTIGTMRNAYGGKVGEEMRFFVENSPDCLDAPGEWQLDRDTGLLSLLGWPGEDLNTVETVAPVAPLLLVLEGDPLQDKWVEHLRFEGLSFRHTSVTVPPTGINDTQGSIYVADGAVEILGAREIDFVGNEIAHTGGHAIFVRKGSNNIRIIQNHLHDLGGGGVYIGNRDPVTRADGTFTPPPEGIVEQVLVENNYIHDLGSIHRQAHGVWIGQSSDNRIRHNEISHTGYTAVSLGWSWGFAESACNRNLVEYNRIHSVSQNVFADCGAIYTLGVQEDTVIRYNHIFDVWGHREYQGKGIYPDEGSRGILFSHNLVHGVSGPGFGINFGADLRVTNNIFAHNASGAMIGRGRFQGTPGLVFERNIVLLDHRRPLARSGTLQGMAGNLYWNQNGDVRFQGGASLPQWQSTYGLDAGSLVADPLFHDPGAGDFRLQAGSPAHALGIEAIDTGQIGLYGDPGWTGLPALVAAARGPQDLPPFAHAHPDPRDAAGRILDDFEASLHRFVNQLNASATVAPGAPYAGLTLYPDPGMAVALSSFSFGARTLVDPEVPDGPGPTRYELRTSADGFAAPVASGIFQTAPGANNYWYFHEHGSLKAQAAADAPLELRLYLLGASGGSRAGAFRMDDVTVAASAQAGVEARTVSYRFTDGSGNPSENGLRNIAAGPLSLTNVGASGYSRVNPSSGYPYASGEVVLADLDADGRYASGGRSASGNVAFASDRAVSGQRSLRMTGASRFAYSHRAPILVNPLKDGGPATAAFHLSHVRGDSQLAVRWVDEQGRQGPRLQLDGPTGQLAVNGQVLAVVPENTWIRIEMQASVGLANTGLWTLVVAHSGGAPVSYPNLTFSTLFHEWQDMEWTVTDSNPATPASFYLDDIELP